MFKDNLGQANHFLVTLLVGLDAVQKGAEAPPSLHTRWNPRSRAESVQRSRDYLLRSTLISTCDAVDTYIRLLNRKPSVLEKSLVDGLDHLGKMRLGDRVDYLAEQVRPPQNEAAVHDSAALMVRLAVSWRNRATHFVNDAELAEGVREGLHRNADEISNSYQGLSVEMMLARFDRPGTHRPPSFKETAAFVRAAQLLVQSIDELLLERMNLPEFLRSWLQTHFIEHDDRVVAIWGKQEAKRRRRLETLAAEAGFSRQASPHNGEDDPVSVEVDRLVSLTVSAARAEFL